MNKSELRIGNYIKIKDDIIRIDEICEDVKDEYFINGISLDKSKGLSADINKLSPIPLTPKILEACGIEEEKFRATVFRASIGDWHIKIRERDGDYLLAMYGYLTLPRLEHISIVYLQELQNIYYFITKTELVINEDKLKEAISNDEK